MQALVTLFVARYLLRRQSQICREEEEGDEGSCKLVLAGAFSETLLGAVALFAPVTDRGMVCECGEMASLCFVHEHCFRSTMENLGPYL